MGLTQSGGGIIVAHSNGAAECGAAFRLLTAEVRSNIDYVGFEGQWHIGKEEYGLKSAVNVRHRDDLVPKLSPGNWGKQWTREIISSSNSPHDFIPEYY